MHGHCPCALHGVLFRCVFALDPRSCVTPAPAAAFWLYGKNWDARQQVGHVGEHCSTRGSMAHYYSTTTDRHHATIRTLLLCKTPMGKRSPGTYGYGRYTYGLHSYGLYGHGLYSYGLYSYGLYSYVNTVHRIHLRTADPPSTSTIALLVMLRGIIHCVELYRP